MAALSKRLAAFERGWALLDDALTIAEREADFRIMLRAVRDEYQLQGGTDPGLPFIVAALEVEHDSDELAQADEDLLDAWAFRHGYTRDDVACNRSQRPARTRAWINQLALQGVSPALEPHARNFWGSFAW